jgi:hypothetical protein
VLSAILFGILYQGGDWISFEMPNITREMIVVIQGLVILFAGALEYMFRPAMAARNLYQQFKRATRRAGDGLLDIFISDSEFHHPPVVPLIFAALAGLFSERAGHLRHRP